MNKALVVHCYSKSLHRTKQQPVIMSITGATNSAKPIAASPGPPAVIRAPDARRQLRAITSPVMEKSPSSFSRLRSTSSMKLTASTSLTEPQQRHAPTNPTTESHRHTTYPALHFESIEGHVEVLSVEPPVYLAKDILGEDMCQAIISAAEAGSMEPVDYEQKVLVNTERLKMLMPLVAVAAVPPMVSSFERGATALEVAATGMAALLAASGTAAALTLAMKRCVEEAIGGRVFVGSKWAGASAQGAAEAAIESAIAKIEMITGRSQACFEPTLVTRYRPGDRQRRHFDTPLPGDEGLEDFELSGGLGQRLVQCLVYLNDLPEGGGGETMFHHPVLSGLKVVPSKGDCLFFFPCFADGEADLRMEHSGEPVKAGTKYILNTWVCQNVSAAQH